ncbi:MAG TPA: enoyl-CoA hydratase family protein [Planctomycetes bacterium]|nr:enoyl-CoA hydratase family protein [Planctomycetota bacterium]
MSPYFASVPPNRTWKHFQVEVREGVCILTFGRPERLNALTFDIYADLRDFFMELPKRSDEIRVVILRGEGKAFCSGGDVHDIIASLVEMDGKEQLAFTRMTCKVIEVMRNLPIPIIAEIGGIAAGAGAVLAIASDFRILSTRGRFAFLFTKVGLSGGDMGAAYLLPRLIGLSRATELLMLGDKVDAETALRIGLAHKVVPPEELGQATMELAARLANGPTEAYAATKSSLQREQDMDLVSALELDSYAQAHLMRGKDFAEFHRAFSNKEEPKWTGE